MKLRKIDWREGSGTSILGVVIMMISVVAVISVIQMHLMQNTFTKAQVICDVMSDGGAVYGALPMEVEENKAYDMAEELMRENQNANPNIFFSLTDFDVATDRSRTGYKDYILTIRLDAESNNLASFTGSDKFIRKTKSKVRILSTVPQNVDLGASRIEFQRALSEVPLNSVKYKAILEGIDYYGWKYSQEYRWTDGARDCSSFVLSCFRDFTSVFDANPYGYTQTIWNDGKNASVLTTINESDLNDGTFDYTQLKTGDILLWHGSWADELGRNPRGLGHVGIYMGVSNEDGLPKILHASSSAGGVCVSNLYGMHSGNNRLLGYIRLEN